MENPTNSYGASQGHKNLQQTQEQVNEVVGIMRMNVEKVLERDQRLADLDSRADALQEGGRRFEQGAKTLHNKYWWKNLKMMIILGVIGVVIVAAIILSFIHFGGKSDDEKSDSRAAVHYDENIPNQAISHT